MTEIVARVQGTVHPKMEQNDLCLTSKELFQRRQRWGISQVVQVHRSFGLPHFLEQHIALRARRKCRGLVAHLFRPCDNSILKSELMFGTLTLGHWRNSPVGWSRPFVLNSD